MGKKQTLQASMRIGLLTTLIIVIFIRCTSDDPQQNEHPADSIHSQGSDLDTTNTMNEDIELKDPLKPLKLCIESATFKSPIIACLDDFESELEEAEKLTADSILVLTINKMYELGDQVYFDEERDVIPDTWELKPELVTKYRKHGFDIDLEEGMYFLTPDFKFLNARFYEVVSPQMRNYLFYRLRNPLKLTYDAGIILDPMDFAARLISLEKLLAENNPVVRELVKQELIYEVILFYSGSDNTPIYDWESQKILPEFRKAAEYLRGSGGKYVRKISEYYFKYYYEYGWKVNHETYEKVLLPGESESIFENIYPGN